MDIPLDKQTLKALANDTRLEILKVLQRRRHTQAELASLLHMAEPSMKKHLDQLARSQLVQRHDEGRKWKYFSLTRKARSVLNPQETKVWVLLGVFVCAVGGTVLSAWRGVQQDVAAFAAESARAVKEDAAVFAAAPVAQSTIPSLAISFGVIAIIAALLLLVLFIRNAQYKKKLALKLSKKERI